DQVLRVLCGQIGNQNVRAAQVQTTLRHGLQDPRELTRGASDLDSLVSRILRQTQRRLAVLVHRGIAGVPVQTARIELCDVRNQLRGADSLPRGGGRESGREVVIRQTTKRKV